MALKDASNVLLLYRAYNHKIELIAPNTLSYTPLYKIIMAKLEETNQYLIDNLYKGFITPSQAPFAAPILFIKKADGSLRFCIDFRKLNLVYLFRKSSYV